MTVFDIIVGVPLLLLFFGGWPALTFCSLRYFASLSRGICIGLALFVGVGFTMFYLRYTASLPGLDGIRLTAEQQMIERVSWLLVIAPYILLLLLLTFRYSRRRA